MTQTPRPCHHMQVRASARASVECIDCGATATDTVRGIMEIRTWTPGPAAPHCDPPVRRWHVYSCTGTEHQIYTADGTIDGITLGSFYSRSDATLAAAAPDLLAACEAALDGLRDAAANSRDGRTVDTTTEQTALRAAIARAKGPLRPPALLCVRA